VTQMQIGEYFKWIVDKADFSSHEWSLPVLKLGSHFSFPLGGRNVVGHHTQCVSDHSLRFAVLRGDCSIFSGSGWCVLQ
jgi:hypothetical protein